MNLLKALKIKENNHIRIIMIHFSVVLYLNSNHLILSCLYYFKKNKKSINSF
jgi:hypothetical protein